MANLPPAESDLLCEECGYILNGLPDTGNCPECGHAIAPSTTKNPRKPPAWEDASNSYLRSWLATTAIIIFAPSKFFRGYLSRSRHSGAVAFASSHGWLAAYFISLAVMLHLQILHGGRSPLYQVWQQATVSAVAVSLLLWIIMLLFTELAARLSAWEAAYRGLRLPLPVVRRALRYHSPHILLVAVLTLITVAAFHYLFQRRLLLPSSLEVYLYTLCGEVIVFAGYLFFTYWAAMRNIMFANR